jgi:hypothetical protein
MTDKRKIGIIVFKAVIVAVAWIYVGYKISSYHISFDKLRSFSFSAFQMVEFFTVLILMICNWSIEAKKWQYSLHSITNISFGKSFQAVLSGTTVGIISPNRTGEPFGRASHLDVSLREKAVSAGIICSLSQFTATVLAGCWALPFYCIQQHLFLNFYLLFTMAIVGTCIMVLLYFNSNHLNTIYKKIPFIKRFTLFGNHFKTCTKFDFFTILVYSGIRYCIFLLQFFLILQVFSIEISFSHSCIAVSMIYFVTTLIPTTTLAELGVRCSSSVYFIGLYCNKPLLIVVASMVLWLINVSVPAIIGSVFYLPGFKKKTV